jgi:hypothetical protein
LLIKDINVSYRTTADWVEDATRRAFQLDEILRRTAISEKARAIFNTSAVTDLEKMARTYEWSVWFWQFPRLNGKDVIGGLMGDMMVVLTPLPESANPLSTNDGQFRIFGNTKGAFAENSGFKKMFRDNGNQVRHATASLPASLLYGLAGFKGAQQRETDNTADCRLNVACKKIADGLKAGEASFQVADVGEIIQRELGDPGETAPWKGPADGDAAPLCSTSIF